MKIIFEDEYDFIEWIDGFYKFKDNFDNFLLVKTAKVIDKSRNIVRFFAEDGNIEYSYATEKRLKAKSE